MNEYTVGHTMMIARHKTCAYESVAAEIRNGPTSPEARASTD